MATYIGKRVVPVVCGNWDINTPYEMLSIVLDTATKHSYISRQEVPAGVPITNTDCPRDGCRDSSQLESCAV